MSTPYVYTLPNEQLIRFYSSEIREDFFNDVNTYSEKKVNTLVVKAPLPETLSISVQNEVNQLYSAFQFKSDLIQFLGGGVGKNFDRGYSQREYWRGPENADISIELHFNTYYSAFIDVMKPTQDLLLMGSSRETSLQGGEKGGAPLGLDEIWAAPQNVIVYFGKYFSHNSMIVKSVEVSYSNKLDNEFYPMSATANITMTPSDPMAFAVMAGGSSKFGGGLMPSEGRTT